MNCRYDRRDWVHETALTVMRVAWTDSVSMCSCASQRRRTGPIRKESHCYQYEDERHAICVTSYQEETEEHPTAGISFSCVVRG